MKIDLHLHSKYSKRPSQWVLQKIGCPESFAEPLDLYHLTQKAGMIGMTLTDHNTIHGCLDIAHLPNTFISEEITTYFPEDGCKVHLLAYNINEAIHRDIQKHRENIYDLVGYLNQNNIIHVLAHPFFSINERLTVEHFEKFLLLFQIFELNGARDESQNLLLKSVVENLSYQCLDELMNRHDLPIHRPINSQSGFVAGSDDHSSLNAARMYTEVPGAEDIREFLAALGTEKCITHGTGSTPRTLAHNLYGIAYQYFNSRLNFSKYVSGDILVQFLDRLLNSESRNGGRLTATLLGFFGRRRRERLHASEKLQDVIQHEGENAILSDPKLVEIAKNGKANHGWNEEVWFNFVNRVCNNVVKHIGENLHEHLLGANVFSIFNSIGATGSLYALLAPYFVSFTLFGRDRAFARQVRERFGLTGPADTRNGGRIKVAHFTDTFYEINGVALTLRQQAQTAKRLGKNLEVLTCTVNGHQDNQAQNFKPIKVFETPEYPEQKLIMPPFLEMLNHVYENEYTYIHSATPGPIGLAALGIARILNLPISGTYHTAIPQYAAYLTGDATIEHLVRRYTLWYYDQMRVIYVPSQNTGDELAAEGIDPRKIKLYPRGVDTARFNPARANGFLKKHFNIGESVKLLYVGRVSKEKNMPLLIDVFKEACRQAENLHLVVVGDGPYLEEMKKRMAGYPCTFTGYLEGDDLAQVYASSDLFVFPSTTDTFGNVILEAQASGLPVIITDMGGPAENIIADETGLLARGNNPGEFVRAILALAGDEARRIRMSENARMYAEKRSFTNAFLAQWDLYVSERDWTHEAVDSF